MNTKLDNKEKLINQVKEMSNEEFQKVVIFISGMEAQKLLNKSEEHPKQTAQRTRKGGIAMEKEISKMTEREILRQQLELLAEASQNTIKSYSTELPTLTDAMVTVCNCLRDY